MSEQTSQDSEIIWTDCPKCGMPIPEGSANCGHCGAKLRDDPPPPPQSEAPPEAPDFKFCSYCGKERTSDGSFCPYCGKSFAAQSPSQVPSFQTSRRGPFTPAYDKNIDTHFALAIIVTLFCCLPGGIIAICYSAKANTLLSVNDIQGAQAAADASSDWSTASISFGIISWVIWFFVCVVPLL